MKKKDHKYIFVIGGVMSGVGKGIAVSSIGKILQSKGLNVNLVKVDPYLNVDAGTMNPTEHGETFVLKNGLETDQDMGNYERFLGKDLGEETMQSFAKLFRASIEHSLKNRKPALDYAMKYGRGLNDELNDKFVGMYVNDLTVDLGPRGESGFQKLLDEGYAKGLIPHKVDIEFVG